MKKLMTFSLVAVLAFGLLAPAEAKKKKPKPAPAPVELQFFMRADEGCEAPYLSLTAGTADDSCYYGVNDMFNEYPSNPLAGDPVDHYVATDGVPFTIDPTRKVTGTVEISAWNGLGMGAGEVDVTLLGTIAGEEKELGTFHEAYTGEPDTNHVSNFEIELDPALAGVVIEGLTLDVYVHGVVVGGRGPEHNGLSFVKVPAIQ